MLPLTLVAASGVLPGCGEEGGEPFSVEVTGDMLVYTSSREGHVHTFAISLAELASPPEDGIRRATSKYEGGHAHEVELSMSELAEIQNGGTVTRISGAAEGHAHTFMFKKA